MSIKLCAAIIAKDLLALDDGITIALILLCFACLMLVFAEYGLSGASVTDGDGQWDYG